MEATLFDRALRTEISRDGMGMPLLVARLVDEAERRVREQIDRRFDELESRLIQRLNALEGGLEGQVGQNSTGAWVRRFTRRLTGWAPQ